MELDCIRSSWHVESTLGQVSDLSVSDSDGDDGGEDNELDDGGDDEEDSYDRDGNDDDSDGDGDEDDDDTPPTA